MKSLKQFLFFGLIIGTLTGLFFQPVSAATLLSRAADIASGPWGSDPGDLVVYNGALYFRAFGGDSPDRELWKYDSTTNTASRAADVYSGPGGSFPADLAVYNGALYFSANGNDGAGYELWKYESSTNTALRVADLYGGPNGSDPEYLAVYNGVLYFQANGNDGAGRELWKYESSTNTALRVADLYSGPSGSNPRFLAVYNGALYFEATGSDGAGNELWKYDSTTNTASRVLDLYAGSVGSGPQYLTVYNGALYFIAEGNDGAGYELWKYDSAANTASRVTDIFDDWGHAPKFLAVYNGALYFQANGNDGAGDELWKYDSATNTTSRVADIYSGPQSSTPAFLAVYNGALYFGADGNDGAGYELWKFFDDSITVILSGNAGVAGATLSYIDGTPKTVISDGSGNYTITVPYGWIGTVTPSLNADAFCPASQTYNNLTTNKTLQHYAHAPCPNFGGIGKWTSSFDSSHGWTVQDYVRTVGDVSGDGQDDLVGFGLDGVYVAVSNGTGFNAVSKWTSAFDLSHGWTVSQFVRTVGDVDGDGDADLVGFGLDGVYVGLSDGSGFAAASKWIARLDNSHGWTVSNHVRTVGDVDGDGKADLVAFGRDGVYVSLSEGSRFADPTRWSISFASQYGWTVSNHVRTVGDVNGDGMADIIGFGLDGVYVATSTGSGFNAISKWTSGFASANGWTVANYVRMVGDVNGDGMADIVGFGQNGVYIGLSIGNGFSLPSRGTTSFDLSHGWTVAQYVRTVGDVNGGGKANLVGFGLDGVYIAPAQ